MPGLIPTEVSRFSGSLYTDLPFVSVRVHSWFNMTSRVTSLALAICIALASHVARAQDHAWHSDVRLGGCGGLYLLAEPGELWVEIEKADRNRSDREIYLRAVFFGPDRTLIGEGYVPDDGQAKGSGTGPVQRIRFSTNVPRAGVYGVALMASNDRYGTEFIWGFTTNCPKYLVETSRGHKDERHQEPIVLYNGEAPGEVCFLPRPGTFAVELSGVPVTETPVTVSNGQGEQVSESRVGESGLLTLNFVGHETPPEALPWRLRLPASQGTVEIDGVTRWDGSDGGYNNLSLWTPKADSWFPFHENRWLLTPYHQRHNTPPGGEGTARFEVHNNGRAEKTVALALEFPEASWPCTLSADWVTLAPGKSAWVDVSWRMPEDAAQAPGPPAGNGRRLFHLFRPRAQPRHRRAGSAPRHPVGPEALPP